MLEKQPKINREQYFEEINRPTSIGKSGLVLKKTETTQVHFESENKNESVTILRLPIFCSQNKPFIFLKIMDNDQRYRLSLNPEFLKIYNLNFKILRDQSLIDFIKLNSLNFVNQEFKNPIVRRKASSNFKTSFKNNSEIFLKLPKLDTNLRIDKHTILLENDKSLGKTIIDKYQIIGKSGKRTCLFIIDRYFGDLYNTSISFISEEYSNFQEFLLDYSKYL